MSKEHDMTEMRSSKSVSKAKSREFRMPQVAEMRDGVSELGQRELVALSLLIARDRREAGQARRS